MAGIYNNAPWRDEVVFLDEAGDPDPIVGPVLIALRPTWKSSGHDFVVLPNEIAVEGHIARFEVPKERMETLCPDDYHMEVGMGAGTDRYIFGWVGQRIIDGINP